MAKAQQNYNARNTTPILFRFNNKNDADIISWLAAQENRQGYIKRLIREDMAAQGNSSATWAGDIVTAITTAFSGTKADTGEIILTPKTK